MSADKQQINISVALGAVTFSITTPAQRDEVRQALSLISELMGANSESIKGFNGHASSVHEKPSQRVEQHDQQKISRVMAMNAEKLKIPQMAVVALWVHGNMTKAQLKEIIENWGKPVGNSLSANFNRDLADKALVREVGKTEKGDIIYGLTEKGKMESEKVVKELEEANNVSS